MELLSKNISSQLNDLVTKCFMINRFLDRSMSLLSVHFKMPNSSKKLHPILAHSILGDDFADSISDYKNSKDVDTIYGATPIGNEMYNNPSEIWYRYQKELLELRDLAYDIVDSSNEEGDYSTNDFVKKFISRIDPYLSQAQVLIDTFDSCDNNKFKLTMLDSQIDDFIEV